MKRAALLLVVGLLVSAGCSLPGRKTGAFTITATFADVGDLVVSHAVQVADVRVGSVIAIELTPDFKAKVTMSIDNVHVPSDAVAELRQTSLLGEKFIELRPCDSGPNHQDTGCQPGSGELQNHADIPIDRTKEAPELEFVADQAVQLLGGVASNDLATLVQTGSIAFGGRTEELRGIVDDLSTISSTLADQTTNIVTIIDGLDRTSSALADNDQAFADLLTNLSQTTTVLANNRQQLVDTLGSLTNLVQAQNQLVFEPYVQQVDLQVKEVDAILARIADGRGEVAALLDWVNAFVYRVPQGIPNDFAQVYAWFAVCPAGC